MLRSTTHKHAVSLAVARFLDFQNIDAYLPNLTPYPSTNHTLQALVAHHGDQ
jgi:hypothetical protein